MIEVTKYHAMIDFDGDMKLIPGMLKGEKVGSFVIQDSCGNLACMTFYNKESVFNLIDGLRELTRIMDKNNCKED